jgi:lipopolysaccharide/colanic/teichoic acid biosynthesis glycosyltransferase
MSLVGIFIFGPVCFIVVVVLFIEHSGSPFYLCQRPGKMGLPFTLFKLKTMRDDQSLPDNMRITKFGLLVRKTSIDEIPQLLNVLRGDMSIVGPRPMLMEYMELYSCEQKQRHNMRPGITGLAQVNGRNLMPFSERFKLDVHYVNNVNFYLDFKIIIRTVVNVLFQKGNIPGQDVRVVDDLGFNERLKSDEDIIA